MRRIGLILALVLLCAGMAAAQAPPNILDGHEVSAAMPDMVLVVTGKKVGIAWAGPLVVQIDDKDSARIALPTVSTDLPRQRWTWTNYLIVIGIGVVSVGSGLIFGHLLL